MRLRLPRLRAKLHLILYILSPLRDDTSHILPYFQFRQAAVAPLSVRSYALTFNVSTSSDVERECITTNLPLSNYIVSVFKRVDGKVAFTNFVIRKRDGHKKAKHRTFSPPGGVLSTSATKLGTLIEEVRTILADMFVSDA